MKGAIILFIVIILLVSAFESFKVFRECQLTKHQINGFLMNINKLKMRIREAKMLKETEGKYLTENVRIFYDWINVFARANEHKNAIEIIGKHENETIETMSIESNWEGIRALPLKVHFFDLDSQDQYFNILDIFNVIQQEIPFVITLIKQSNHSLEISLSIYGR